ncbi:MAG: hypothetical protein ACRD82_10915, partial [Blastocatellia bacterium]
MQSTIDHRSNFAPRAGFTWSPFKTGRLTIRAGGGVFYQWVATDILEQLRRVDGQQQLEIVVENPGFPNPFAGGMATSLPPGRMRLSPMVRLPYFEQASFGAETFLGKSLELKVTYFWQRGVHLLRGRNLNAPGANSQRLDAESGNIVQVEDSANSIKHLVNIGLNNLISKRFYWFVNYSWSKAVDDANGAFSLPADNFNLRAERGPSSEDVRHRLNGSLSLGLFKRVRLGTLFNFNSPKPYNITTGADNNRDTSFNDRPLGVGRNSARGTSHYDLGARLSWSGAFGKRKDSDQSQSGGTVVTVSRADIGALASGVEAADKRW